ncbi:fec operon regulator FecR [compost metagenome]
MEHEDIKNLIAKYQDGTASQEERLVVDEWYNFITKKEASKPVDFDVISAKDAIWSRLSLDIQEPKKNKSLYLYVAGLAAAIALILSGVYFFFTATPPADKPMVKNEQRNDVGPGKFGATLTLANGRKIRLADVSKGELAKEAGISISKTADGQLVYSVEKSVSVENAVNTIATANGEIYEIHLPDGTLIHLNAASSLTYKTSLVENGKRVVSLKGEGYFEVAKDKQHPFIVKTDKQEVEVLGTHFNISSYADDEVEKTTLLEGSIRLRTAGISRILKPGQQGKLRNGKLTVVETDTDLAVAWKNNEFMFESERIEDLMKMVERWYNVEVIYVGEKTTERFSGGVSRFDNISKVLNIVEATGASHFTVKGRKIYVSK